MIVYKFGGATTRTRRGLEAVTDLIATAQRTEVQRRKRSRTKAGAVRGLIVVVSAIGHTTRHLARAAEFAAAGNLALAEDALERTIEQHRQLLRSLKLDAEQEVLERFDEIGDQTSALIEGVSITRELSARSRDAIVAHGEDFAMALLDAALREHGLPVRIVEARSVIITNERFGHAEPNYTEIHSRVARHVLPHLRRSEIVLTQGYIGATPEGDTTTMGSESSDLTATLLAGALAAEEVVIWKTVQGIYTADPELVPEAKLIRMLSFEEAEEIGRRGARILFPAIAHPILREGQDTVLRIATPLARTERHTSLKRMLPVPRKERPLAIAADPNMMLVRIQRSSEPENLKIKRQGLENLLSDVPYTWLTGGECRAVVTRDRRAALQQKLAASGWTMEIIEHVGTIGVVVRGARSTSTETMHSILRTGRGLPVIAIMTIEKSIVVVVPEAQTLVALRKLHKALFTR